MARVNIKIDGQTIRAATDFVRLMFELGGSNPAKTKDLATLDPYLVLGLPRDATEKEITQRYWKLSHVLHPDKGGNSDAMKRLNEAYRLICQERQLKT